MCGCRTPKQHFIAKACDSISHKIILWRVISVKLSIAKKITGLEIMTLSRKRIQHVSKLIELMFKRGLQWNLYEADIIGAKKVSALQRCPLYRDFFQDSLTAKQSSPFLVILSVLQRCPLYRDSTVHCLQGCFTKQTDALESIQEERTFKFVNPKHKDRASVCNDSLSLNLLLCCAERNM